MMGIEAIGLALFGLATFLGLFVVIGRIVGKELARKKKISEEKILFKISDPTIKEMIKNKMKEADEYISNSDGEQKMRWVFDQVAAFIPGVIDDKIIRDFFQGVYESYKDEINK